MSKIIDKIRALLAKTTSAGCTEAEALAAAEVARRLMVEHDVTVADVAEREAFHTIQRRTPVALGIEDWLAGPIAAFFDCVAVKSRGYDYARGRSMAEMKFFGRDADVIMAGWLFETLVKTAKRNYRAWLDEMQLSPCTERKNGFFLGFAGRVSERLTEMRRAGAAEAPAGHTELVVARNAARDAAYALAFPKAKPSVMRGRAADNASVESGQRAGDAASLSRPVGASAGPAMLR